MARPGRKHPKVTDDKVKRLLAALTTGHYMERAARLAGIGTSTPYLWMDHGNAAREARESGLELDEAQKAYLEILEAIEKGREAAAHRALLTIQQAAQAGTWQAAAWYLERTDREHYGRVTQVSGPDNGPIQVKVDRAELTAEILRLIGDEEDDPKGHGDLSAE